MGAIHGASDTDQPATRFSLPLWNAVGGSGTPTTWSRAGTTNYFLLIDSNLGHDVWDYYYPWPNGQFFLALAILANRISVAKLRRLRASSP